MNSAPREFYFKNSMLVPAGTPKAVVERSQGAVASLLKNPQVRDRFLAQGLDIYGTSPVDFETYRGAEISKWNQVARAARIQSGQ